MKKTILWALIALLSMSVVLAAATMRAPLGSGKMTGSAYIINVSIGLATAKNCTVTFTSAKTGDSQAYVVKNSSAGKTYCETASSTRALIDSNDYAATGTCYNYSGSAATITAIASVLVDNTKPLCAFSDVTQNEEFEFTQDWTVTATNATSCRIGFSDQWFDMVESSDSCTYTADAPIISVLSLQATSTDGTNTTACTSYSVNLVDSATQAGRNLVLTTAAKAGAQQTITTQQQASAQQKQTLIVLALVGGVVLYFIYKKK